MEDEIVIDVKNVVKSFRVYGDKGNQLRQKVMSIKRNSYEKRQVLRGITFQVRKGEAIGLIGHNGCGKSTTLKLLTKIMYPDSGSIKMKGRVSSLIELGAGFHPDLSGRENIFINASIFGLKRKEIEARLEDIIAFSELEDFIDNPVRTYSSGMYMRLAFSVAINVNADILLIDEILAVGDANFQSKCFDKLRAIKEQGTTIVIVSHSMGQIEQICDRSVWIDEGLVREDGAPRDVHPIYLEHMGQQLQKNVAKEEARTGVKNGALDAAFDGTHRWGGRQAEFTKIELIGADGHDNRVFETGEDICIKIQYQVNEPIKDVVFGIGIFRDDRVHCYGDNTRLDGLRDYTLTEDGSLELRIRNLGLLPGRYTLDFSIEYGEGIPVDFYTRAMSIQVYAKQRAVGVLNIDHEWNTEGVR